MRSMFFVFVCCISCLRGEIMEEVMPKYIYKIVTKEDWEASQTLGHVQLALADEEFIHFSKEDQLERILVKYWNDVPDYVVLTIDPQKLPGRMVLEANPGGNAKYYHLYEGSIPLDAIVDKVV